MLNIMKNGTHNTIDTYPIVLKVHDLVEITGLGIQTCYQMCKSEGFPALRLTGSSIYLIPRDAFFSWLENSALNSENKLQ